MFFEYPDLPAGFGHEGCSGEAGKTTADDDYFFWQ
jgi:hypothetical protein